MIFGAMVSEATSVRSPVIAACLSLILLTSFTFSTFTSTFLDFAFARIDVLIIRGGLHLGVVRTGYNLRDLLLLLIELQLDQEFGEHRVDYRK